MGAGADFDAKVVRRKSLVLLGVIVTSSHVWEQLMECTRHKPEVFGPYSMTIIKLKQLKRTQPSSELIMTGSGCTFMSNDTIIPSVTGLNMKIWIQLKNPCIKELFLHIYIYTQYTCLITYIFTITYVHN